MFERLCLIGVGLIGGSIARAARRQGLCKEIVAFAPEKYLENLQVAQQLGVIDCFYTEPAPALEQADCVIIATPVGAVLNVFRQIAPYWNDKAVYSDACSTKRSVITAAQAVFGKVPDNFVPGHPIAGAERSGVQASSENLFDRRRTILTPLDNTDAQALSRIAHLWEGLGSSVSIMAVDHHDTVLAATSHFPHILAFALVGLLGRKDEKREIFKYAAGGFKDFSRIASSDPTMWLDICMANKQEIIPLIQQFQDELTTIENMLLENQTQQLFETFTYAGHARKRFLDQLDD